MGLITARHKLWVMVMDMVMVIVMDIYIWKLVMDMVMIMDMVIVMVRQKFSNRLWI
jgi:hypothetical protein